MSAPAMVLTRPTEALATYTPDLMPFHINYTGPAAVSAYLRVEKLKIADTTAESNADETTQVDSNATTTDAETTMDVSQTAESADTESQATLVASAATSQAASPPSITPSSSTTTAGAPTTISPPPPEDADRRAVASFRGRTIHGLTLDLPAGYGGLVLQSQISDASAARTLDKPTAGTAPAKAAARGKAKADDGDEEASSSTRPRRGRLTRSAAPSKKPIEVLDDDKDVVMSESKEVALAVKAESDHVGETEGNVRRLVPAGQFSAFTLWQPDRVVDKNRDEYYRSLTEWISLANEVHGVDSD